MASPLRRRRFRFSSRTFFVVIMLLAIPCAWLARELAIVRERKTVFELILSESPNHSAKMWFANEDLENVSWWRRWLGDDVLITEAYYPPGTTEAKIERVKAAFPEATVEAMNP